MTMNEMRSTARDLTRTALSSVLEVLDAVQFADGSFAVLQKVDGQEIWTEICIKSKSWKPTKVSEAFDPYEAAEAWHAEQAMKAEEKAAKAKEKEKKIARDAEKRAKEKEKEA